MPWISKELCTGCQACVDECSVGAISMQQETAFIREDECIRCGVCHEVCPVEAVRHDGERIPEEVKSNLDWARTLLAHEYYTDDRKRQKELIERLRRYFNKNKKVAEKTIEKLNIMENTEYGD